MEEKEWLRRWREHEKGEEIFLTRGGDAVVLTRSLEDPDFFEVWAKSAGPWASVCLEAGTSSRRKARRLAKRFAANPRFARYFNAAEQGERVRVSPVQPGEAVERNMYSHHRFAGVYGTIAGACEGD